KEDLENGKHERSSSVINEDDLQTTSKVNLHLTLKEHARRNKNDLLIPKNRYRRRRFDNDKVSKHFSLPKLFLKKVYETIIQKAVANKLIKLFKIALNVAGIDD
uniref:Uncharacterized protein n=1 Tax=Strongyloides stercoralis TaxID=6248 RepID=A0AAF5DM32_STRER